MKKCCGTCKFYRPDPDPPTNGTCEWPLFPYCDLPQWIDTTWNKVRFCNRESIFINRAGCMRFIKSESHVEESLNEAEDALWRQIEGKE